mgnify:CR=1 FL=1
MKKLNVLFEDNHIIVVEKLVNDEKFLTKNFTKSEVEYINSKTKVCIICPKHGEFWITPNNHVIQKQGCSKCSHRSYKYSNEEFINKAKEIHGDKYDYSKVEYKNGRTKVCITCPIHGEFWQTPYKHLSGQGCQICAKEQNVNETKLFIFLKNNLNTNIERESKLKFLNGKSVDIYIPEYRIAIEYQGIQHFQAVDFFGGQESYKANIKRDFDKYNECKENNVKLFYFSKEKQIPKNYIDDIFINENELLNKIKNYAYNR